MIDYIAYIAIRLLNRIFAFVPISLTLWLGRRLGSIAFAFNKRRRLVAYANLKAAFAKEKPPRELRILTKKVYQNLFETVVEIINLTKVDKRYVDHYIDIINLERVEEARKSGRGIILLTGHFGCWELSSLVSAVAVYPILVLVREQKMKRVNELLNQLRESKGCRVVRKGMPTKNILKALRDGEMVGILSDQDAGRNGVFVDFFGRPTSCHSGPMEIAMRTNSIVLPNFIVRVKGPRHKIFVEEWIDARSYAGTPDGVKKGLQKFADILESYVRRYPDQWLWLHKRWKSTPTRTVLVLNDGKTGHLNQSLSVAREIRRARVTEGYKPDDTKIIAVDIRFKNRFSKGLLSFCAHFATWRCHGCMRCMRLALEDDCYKTLMSTYSDFVISCGSSTAAANVFMSKENNARNVIIMKPGALGLKKFGLAVIPRHDRPRKAPNVVTTAVAPNLIDKEALESGSINLKKHFSIEGDSFIGLLIGGDNPEFSLTKYVVEKALEGLLDICGERGFKILVTTSRRTSPEVERYLKDRLADEKLAAELIIANENNVEGAVAGMLGLSGVVIVSGESISMVSEAISSGKKVVAFMPEKRSDVATKHERAIKDLEREGYIDVCAAEGLREAVKRALDDKRPAKKLDASEKIFEAVRRLI